MTAREDVQAKIDDLRLALQLDPKNYIDSPEWTTDAVTLLLDAAEAALRGVQLFAPGEYDRCVSINPDGARVKLHDALVGLVSKVQEELEGPPMPDWAPAEGPWCLKEWIPLNVSGPKVQTCLLDPEHDGDCRDVQGSFLNRDNAIFVGRLKTKDEARDG